MHEYLSISTQPSDIFEPRRQLSLQRAVIKGNKVNRFVEAVNSQDSIVYLWKFINAIKKSIEKGKKSRDNWAVNLCILYDQRCLQTIITIISS